MRPMIEPVESRIAASTTPHGGWATSPAPRHDDVVSLADTRVSDETPAFAAGSLFVYASTALSNAARNSTAGQQQACLTPQAAAVQGRVTYTRVDAATGALVPMSQDEFNAGVRTSAA